ncbi:MAG: hypothetical protein WAT12_16360 [Candidatus Nitrotoga sp.]
MLRHLLIELDSQAIKRSFHFLMGRRPLLPHLTETSHDTLDIFPTLMFTSSIALVI